MAQPRTHGADQRPSPRRCLGPPRLRWSRGGFARCLGVALRRPLPRLFRLVRSRTKRDDAFAIDCVHDAWLRVVDHLPIVASLEALDRWLARAAISAAIDRIRADAARSRREADRAIPPPADPNHSAELIEQMQRELATLDPPDRTVIDLRFRAGLSLEAIGATLGIGMKAAEIRLRRALARLRGRLDSLGVRRGG